MAQRSTQTGRTGQRRPAQGDQSAYERLNASVEAAQVALKELRGELGRGSRELLHDVDVTLRDARKNLRSVSRQVVKELEQVQQAAAGKRADFLVLEANPLDDIRNTRRIAGVFLNGAALDREALAAGWSRPQTSR